MGSNTRIDWTDNSVNFWMGCTETSNPGCQECYAIHRLLPGRGIAPGIIQRTSDDTWQGLLRWQKRLEASGEVESVFANSLSDFFHPRADQWREEAWAIIRQTHNLQYMILTQRESKIEPRLPSDWGDGYPNVWLGISASDQLHADQRIPNLLKIPAVLHFVSLEPLVQPVRLRSSHLERLGWVITGGMSGRNWERYRLYPSWVRTLRDQCTEAEVPFFFKQLGGPPLAYRDGDEAILDDALWKQIPDFTCQPIRLPKQEPLF